VARIIRFPVPKRPLPRTDPVRPALAAASPRSEASRAQSNSVNSLLSNILIYIFGSVIGIPLIVFFMLVLQPAFYLLLALAMLDVIIQLLRMVFIGGWAIAIGLLHFAVIGAVLGFGSWLVQSLSRWLSR